MNTPGNAISETLIFKMSLDALAVKKLVPLVRVPKPPTVYYSLSACYLKRSDSPTS